MSNKNLSVAKIRYGEEFEWLVADDVDYDKLTFDARPRAALWNPICVRRLKVNEDGTQARPSAFPAGSIGDLAMSGAAKEMIGHQLESFGEILPLACDDGEFWTLNVTFLIDALDETKSEVLRASDEDCILMIHKHVFRAEMLQDAVIFKLPQFRRGPVFVTERFIDLIKRSGLVGLLFKQVWTPS